MKCFFCGEFFNEDFDPGDCPGVCGSKECLAFNEESPRWEEFLNAKHRHIIAVLARDAGRPYVHVSPADESEGMS